MRLLLSFAIILLSNALYGDFKIEGKINLEGEWQNQIYLATIDKLDNYYNANAESIIAVAPINEDGTFLIEGNNLPDYQQYYRLYLIKEEHSEFNACLFVGGDEHNFVHLLLDNNAEISIEADGESFAPFGNYKISGEASAHLMKDLGELLYPSYIFYEIKFPSELKFSQDKLNRDLFAFADTCSNTLVALASLNNTDYDAYYDANFQVYQDFGKRLAQEYPKHPYTENYKRKMRYYGTELNASNFPLFKFTTGILAALCVLLIWRNAKLKNQLSEPREISTPEIKMTPQEIKILDLIVEGKSNKEIANDLFIELSTVKSHINKLYAKLKVKSRSEAIIKAKAL